MKAKNIGKDIAELAETHYFIFPEAIKTEVCKGEDYRVVAKLLINKGYMNQVTVRTWLLRNLYLTKENKGLSYFAFDME